ncbi:hypothetical protein Vid5_gp52 [Pantoea phage vB_PagS_Vid5]|uniref:DNA binding protein n=1 Tax=Pantoea phage vB_PagS_Vid5 TaxID=2099652 RepID=A0A2P1CKM5_9CAUD|nr:hypothetical protein FDJ45_gp052 [Pantoea phage vB_PagS_Vid5]AVJ51807.1 hypothetical protein Vid5_gp52 [Pantoea phage vB_PagS_Vid5]
MVQVPEDKVTMEDLVAWYNLKQELQSVQARERAMRDRITRHFFPTITEGTNKTIFEGSEIKAVQSYTRDIDPAVYAAVTKDLYDLGVDTSELVSFKPSLVTAAYRKLQGNALAIFNQCVSTKPGSVQLTITQAKPGKG